MAYIEKGLGLATQPSPKFITLPSGDTSENSGSLHLRQALYVRERTRVSPVVARVAASLFFSTPEKWERG